MNLLQISGLTVIGIVGLQALLGLIGLLRRQWYERKTFQYSLRALESQLAAVHTKMQQAALLQHAWSGLRKFEVVRKEEEAPGVYSFYLHPHDHQPLPPFLPGQYLTFHLRIPGQSKPVIRCYSLSDWHNPDSYRVTIKRALPPQGQHGAPPGVASNYFCDHVAAGDILDVEAPRGRFVLELADERPIVLIGGGIGVTPVLCMLSALVATRSTREIWFFLSVRDPGEYLFRDFLEEAARRLPNLRLNVCFSGMGKSKAKADPETASRQSVTLGADAPQLVREGGGQNYMLRSNVVIGRAPDCDICVAHPGVSGRHARIYQQSHKWYVEDLGSTNGTYIGEQPVQGRVEIRDQDSISFARLTFQFVLPASSGRNADRDPDSSAEAARIHYGRLTPEVLMRELPSTNYIFFLCGPAAMMADLGDALERMGVPKGDIRFEAFGPATRASRAALAGDLSVSTRSTIEIKFARSNVTRRWNPLAGNLLAFAGEAGVSIPSGCCAGSCGTCLVAVREGEFEYTSEGGADAEPGSCLACIAVPTTNLVLDA